MMVVETIMTFPMSVQIEEMGVGMDDAKEFVNKMEEGANSLMVSMGIDEPLKETEYGMKNPFRTGLGDFLA